MEEILALLTINDNGGQGNNDGHNNNVRKPPKVGIPILHYKFYCWSYGVNPTHNSCGCNNKKPGQQIAIAYTNQFEG